jgi:hypothetical protein
MKDGGCESPRGCGVGLAGARGRRGALHAHERDWRLCTGAIEAVSGPGQHGETVSTLPNSWWYDAPTAKSLLARGSMCLSANALSSSFIFFIFLIFPFYISFSRFYLSFHSSLFIYLSSFFPFLLSLLLFMSWRAAIIFETVSSSVSAVCRCLGFSFLGL